MIRRRRQRQGTVLITFLVACGAIFTLLLHIAGGTNLASKYNVDVIVPNAVQLVPGADVREAGVDVGTVTGISNRGASAVLALAINKKYAPIYRDGTVRVATKTLVGENYIDLNPGEATAQAVPNGGTLGISQANEAVQLDQILSTFTPATQARLRTLLAGFGGGLTDRGQALNQTLDALSGTVNNAAPVAQALSDQSQQLNGFVSDFGSVLSALGQRSAEIQQFVRAGTQAAVTVSARDAALRQTLKDLPPTIATVNHVAAHLASVGTRADPVLDNLSAALSDLTPALKTLPSAGAATLSALQRVQTVTPTAEKLVAALRGDAPSITGLVGPLASTVNQLRPLIAYLAPYAPDLDHLLFEMDSVGRGVDVNGLLAQLDPLISAGSVQNLPAAEKQLLNELVGKGLASILNEKGVNAYPAPGTATDPQPLTTTVPQLQPDTGG